MLCLLNSGQRLDKPQLAELRLYDPAYLAYITGAQHLLAEPDAKVALQACGNAFEAFHTGTEANPSFFRAAIKQ